MNDQITQGTCFFPPLLTFTESVISTKQNQNTPKYLPLIQCPKLTTQGGSSIIVILVYVDDILIGCS